MRHRSMSLPFSLDLYCSGSVDAKFISPRLFISVDIEGKLSVFLFGVVSLASMHMMMSSFSFYFFEIGVGFLKEYCICLHYS